MVGQKMVGSRSEARRLIEQQGVKIDGIPVEDLNVVLNEGNILQVGKRRFLRLVN